MKRTKRKSLQRFRSDADIADIEDFKAFLGPLADDYTVPELRQLRNEMQAMAEILLSAYIQKQRGDMPVIRF